MSHFEIGIIVLICCLPILALILVLPKMGKKGKTKAKAEPPKQEPVKEEPKKEEPKPEEEKKESKLDKGTLDYLEKRKQTHPAPTFKQGTPPPFGGYSRAMFNTPRQPTPQKKEEGSLAEQIEGLSPELKALLMSGALNRKDFDDNNT